MKIRPVSLCCGAFLIAGLLAVVGGPALPAGDTPGDAVERYQLHLNTKGELTYLLDTTSGEVFKKFGGSWSSEIRGAGMGRYQLFLDAKGDVSYLCNGATGEVYKKFGGSWSSEIRAVK